MNDTETKTWQMCSLLESEIAEAVGWSQEEDVMLSRPIFECGHLEQVLGLLAFEVVAQGFFYGFVCSEKSFGNMSKLAETRKQNHKINKWMGC